MLLWRNSTCPSPCVVLCQFFTSWSVARLFVNLNGALAGKRNRSKYDERFSVNLLQGCRHIVYHILYTVFISALGWVLTFDTAVSKTPGTSSTFTSLGRVVYLRSHVIQPQQSVSQWNAWPATGRSTLQDSRSRAILQASLALSQCRPRSAAPKFGRVVHAGASTPAGCPVYRLQECPQPGVVRSGPVSLPVVAARDQKWTVASDKSGLVSLLRQFG